MKGIASFRLRQETFQACENSVFVYRVGEPHQIEALSEILEYRWITFDGDSLLVLDVMKFDTLRLAVKCPSHLFRSITKWIEQPTAEAERNTSALGYQILLSAVHSPRDTAPVQSEMIYQAKNEIDRNYSDCNFNINMLSDRMAVHRTTLFRLFKEKYGIAPGTYLLRLRLKFALQKLQEPMLRFSEIAHLSGINDPAYLSRLIRKATGKSPAAIRKQFFRKEGEKGTE